MDNKEEREDPEAFTTEDANSLKLPLPLAGHPLSWPLKRLIVFANIALS